MMYSLLNDMHKLTVFGTLGREPLQVIKELVSLNHGASEEGLFQSCDDDGDHDCHRVAHAWSL